MFRIAICDDEISICEQLEVILEKLSREFLEGLEWDVFYSGEELCSHLDKNNYYDIIFLDIKLKEMNGVEVGHIIRNAMLNETTQIVYISGKETYAMELFKLRPLDFIIKPFDYQVIKGIINLALRTIKIDYAIFQYKIGTITYNILTKDILYFESKNRKIIMHGVKRTETFYGKLKDVHEKLKKYRFIKIHKSYLVNYNHIVKLEYQQVTLSNKKNYLLVKLIERE